MMLEDTLIYNYNPPANQTFAALLAADLADDELDFYLRMSGDMVTVADETNHSNEGDRLAESLLDALVSTPGGRTKAWREFYRGVRRLVSGFAPALSDTAAFRRLRQFVRENADLADALVIGNVDQAAYCHALGA
jgi:hypothetical protein